MQRAYDEVVVERRALPAHLRTDAIHSDLFTKLRNIQLIHICPTLHSQASIMKMETAHGRLHLKGTSGSMSKSRGASSKVRLRHSRQLPRWPCAVCHSVARASSCVRQISRRPWTMTRIVLLRLTLYGFRTILLLDLNRYSLISCK